MRTTIRTIVIIAGAVLGACSAEEEKVNQDFAFDGTCVNCHNGLSSGHVHSNYKLRCVDCHGGDDQVDVAKNAFETKAEFTRQDLMKAAHVLPDKDLARFFFANGIDDDGDGMTDEPPVLDATTVIDKGEVFEPGLHGEGPGEFVDTELSRDLNYTRFLNPGDLRVATVGCGGRSRAALDGGGGGACHQQTIDVVRRSIMVNQSAVINGAYYGNESWRNEFIVKRGNTADPREGAFAYGLDYDGADKCIDVAAAMADPNGRTQPVFNRACLQARATLQDVAVARDAQGNAGLPAFEIAQGTITPVAGVADNVTIEHTGAGDTRLPWGGKASTSTALAKLDPIPCNNPINPGPGCEIDVPLQNGVPDPVDNILRTFRAYYPINYPGSTNNFNFTFGTSIDPEFTRFKTKNPYGRGHSSGCSACHAPYAFDGSRAPQRVRQDDGTFVDVVDPTTKHREFNATQDRGPIAGKDSLLGRAVSAQEQLDTGRAQQKTYSRDHVLTAKADTDTCGMCHAFVTRINYAYQGMAEEEQRDALARRKAIEFTTPAPGNTQVRIVDSWVREDKNVNQVIIPEGVAVAEAARKRDADLAVKGIIPGAGGCAQAVFSEDCNNNGELDTELVLQRFDESGNVIATATINEDANGNGKLELIDRVPREKSLDGRQVRYIYGGRNGSTRQMDVHFERGMHCIDCHFLQDVHGDGHVYSTNWDAIEIECQDCHGSTAKANLVTSGPNGGNNLKLGRNDELQPFFEDRGGAILQRSRVTPGVFWKIPQTVDQQSPYAKEAHDPRHLAAVDAGSEFAGAQGSSELTSAKLECATCHSSWIHNCMGCHVDLNLGDLQRTTIDRNGGVAKSAGENEVWLSNSNNKGHINFQLLGLLRAPFILGVSSTSEKGMLGPFRSSMQVHVSVTDTAGHTVIDNATFTTFQAKDANSGRTNVATSGVAMNQTMPHTVRPDEARDCATCHSLVDNAGNARNEHLLAETYGLGTGAYPYVGDWGIAAGGGGIELFEYKQEKELAANAAGKSQRFPGMIVNPVNRTIANVEPIFGGGATANDVVLIRNFQPSPVGAMLGLPTLKDLAVVAVDTAGTGTIVVTDLTGRGHPNSTRQAVGVGRSVVLGGLPQPPRALAHLSPDASDPIVYAAVGTAGVSVIKVNNPPPAVPQLVRTVPSQNGRTANDLILAGDLLYVGTTQGFVDVFSISANDATMLTPRGSVNVGSQVNDLALAGFVLYAATNAGLVTISLKSPENPTMLSTAPVGGLALGVAVREGRAYIAGGAAGVTELDVRTAAAPKVNPAITATAHTAQDVIVSDMPGQTWILALETAGSMVGIKLDNTESLREKCFPDPGAKGCLLDLQFMDATQMSRDPSFDPITKMFDLGVDPSAVQFFRQTPMILNPAINPGKRLARPSNWETLGTLTGRRLRDSFMPGSGSLSFGVMDRMHRVELCESAAPSTSPSGLNTLGYYAGPGVDCQPFGLSQRPAPLCRPVSFGSTTTTCRPPESAAVRAPPAAVRAPPASQGRRAPALQQRR